MRVRPLVAALFGVFAALGPLAAMAGPTLLFDPKDGRILYGEQVDDQWHPASLTKIMTAYLAFEALKAGKVTLETPLKVSEQANIQPPSKIGLPVDAELSLELALQALIVKSANDVAVMIAEGIGGSEEQFVAQMNSKARQLGMMQTTFVNANGLPAAEQVTTARDLALLSAAVLKDFPEFAHYWSMQRMKIGKIRLASHNSLLKTFDGADGLKTGFICDSGFNIVASASRGDRRLMAIVLGEATVADRGSRAEALLAHGFETLDWKTAFLPLAASIHSRPTTVVPVRSVRSEVKATACGWRQRRVKRALKVSEKARDVKAKGRKKVNLKTVKFDKAQTEVTSKKASTERAAKDKGVASTPPNGMPSKAAPAAGNQ